MVPFVDLSIEQLRSRLEANVVSQVVVIKAVLPAMFKASRGTIVDITSTVAVTDPPAPVGQGGWGIGYAASKGAFHRIAGILAVELGARGLRAYNVDPGYVNTERQLLNAADNGLEGHYVGAPPSVPASVVVWLATAPYAAAYNGQTIKAQKFALDHALHPPWRQRGQQPSPLNN